MSRFFVRFSVLLYILAGSAVFAQSTAIPKDLLDLDHRRCMNDCVPSFGETTCKPLCDCTISEFKKRLDFDKYLVLSVQMSRSEISPENGVMLREIALFCTAELDRMNVEVGGPEKPADEEKEDPADKAK